MLSFKAEENFRTSWYEAKLEFIKMRKVDVVVQPLILALGRQKQEDLHELKLSLVYIQVSHGYTVRLSQRK